MTFSGRIPPSVGRQSGHENNVVVADPLPWAGPPPFAEDTGFMLFSDKKQKRSFASHSLRIKRQAPN